MKILVSMMGILAVTACAAFADYGSNTGTAIPAVTTAPIPVTVPAAAQAAAEKNVPADIMEQNFMGMVKTISLAFFVECDLVDSAGSLNQVECQL